MSTSTVNFPYPYTKTWTSWSNGSSPACHEGSHDSAISRLFPPLLLILFFLVAGCKPSLGPTNIARLEAMLEQGHFIAAETEARHLLTHHTEVADLHMILARALLLQQRPAEAVTASQQAELLLPDSPWPALWSAIAFLQTGQMAKAELALRKCLDNSPGFPLAHFFWGSAILSSARSINELAAAEMHLARAADHSGEILPAALNNLGLTQWRLGRLNDAYRTFLRAVDHGPYFLPARVNLALLLAVPLQDPRTAINVLTAIPQRTWRGTEFEKLVAPAFSHEVETAASFHVQVERYLTQLPVDPLEVPQQTSTITATAEPTLPPDVANIQTFASNQATTLLTENSASQPSATGPKPYSDLSEALRMVSSTPRENKHLIPRPQAPPSLRDRRRAQAFLRQALNLQIANSSGPEVIALFFQAIEADATYSQAYYNLSIECWRQNRIEEAIESMSIALELDPSTTSGRLQLAGWLISEGYFQEAANHISIAVNEEPENFRTDFLAAQLIHSDPRATELTRKCLENAISGFLSPTDLSTAERLLKDLPTTTSP